uniref:nitric oxide dioxygenase n=2 Tax=Aplanochytrium stocchinoi TaxID=215587 RepID=A0A6S8DL27_9STRA
MVMEHIDEITEVFYPRMFDHNSEMLFYFNEANQRNHMQQKAIARAVMVWAKHLHEPDKFKGLLDVISHRHVALYVTQDLYSIIYDNFMHSMTQVLGGNFTSDMVTAWSDAFIWLCKMCIENEAALAKAYEKRQGGWAGERKFKLVGKRKIAETTIQFDFSPVDLLPWHQNAEDGGIYFDPGQYLTIRIPGTGLSPRHYTVTSLPGQNVLQCVSRLVPNGAVSSYMHEEFLIGDRCLLTVPCGLFTPYPKSDMVMISAGIGITPMYAFLNTVERKYIKGILHFDQSAERMAFRDAIEGATDLDTKIIFTGDERFAEQKDIETETNVLAIRAGIDADYYVCGPLPFMDVVKKTLQSHGIKNVFCHHFGTGTEPMCPFRR